MKNAVLPTRPAETLRLEVIHPSFDVQEEKCDASTLPPMKLKGSVRFSLFVLRAYLILMGALLAYHLLDLSGAFRGHK